MEIRILPLSRKYLQSAIELTTSTFSHWSFDPCKDLEMSLSVFEEYFVDDDVYVSLQYFIAVDLVEDSLLGVIWLEEKHEDKDLANRIWWFCVNSICRWKWVWRKLISHIESLSRNQWKRYLRLYTSTHPTESIAQQFYEKLGYSKISWWEKYLDTCKMFCREKIL